MKSQTQKSRIFHPTCLDYVGQGSRGKGGQFGAVRNGVSLRLPARADVTDEVQIILIFPENVTNCCDGVAVFRAPSGEDRSLLWRGKRSFVASENYIW